MRMRKIKTFALLTLHSLCTNTLVHRGQFEYFVVSTVSKLYLQEKLPRRIQQQKIMSGIEIDEKVLEVYEAIKFHSTYKYAVFRFEGRKLMVETLGSHLVTHTKQEDSTAFAEVQSLLGEMEEPRYVLYDFQFRDDEETRLYDKISFIFWSPGSSKMKQRMLYTANKESVLKHFPGVIVEFQANDPDDLEYSGLLHDVKHKASVVQPIE